MKLKKLFITMLAVAVMVAYMPSAAFASPTEQVSPRLSAVAEKSLSGVGEEILETEMLGNLSAEVYPDNDECRNVETSEAVLKITDKDGNAVVEEKLVFDDEMGVFSFEGKLDGVDAIIDAISEDYMAEYDSILDEIDTIAIMEKYGYNLEVIVEDGDDEHEYVIEDLSAYLINEEVLNDTLDFVAAIAIAMFEEEIEASLGIQIEFTEVDGEEVPVVNGEVLTFAKFIEIYEEFLTTSGELEGEELEEALGEIKVYEELMSQFANGFKGQLVVEAFAKCNCPEVAYYAVYHEYYNKEGLLVDFEADWPTAEAGTVIDVKDLKYVTEYNGVKYQVEGVYLYDEELDDIDYSNPVTEFVVDEDTEVSIKYVPVSAGGAGTGDVDNDEETSKDNKVSAEKENKGDVETPETGDETPLALIVVLMAAALVIMRKVKA